MNIIILCGGTSTERYISIISGSGAAKALRERGHNVFLLDVFDGCDDKAEKNAFDNSQDIDAAAEVMISRSDEVQSEARTRRTFFGQNVLRLCYRADSVFMALHGANGEDGKVQAAFDLFGINYSGSGHVGSALAMDKGLTKILFNYFGIPTPKGFVIHKSDTDHSLEGHDVALPVVVKPLCGGSSVGVYIARTKEEYERAVKAVFLLEDKAMVESYIKGREFSVAVVNGKAYPVVEIIVEDGFYDYENKYNGKTTEVCPADIPEEKAREMQKAAIEAVRALSVSGYARMDFMMDEEWKIYCIEANTLPGMTPTSLIPQEAAAIGISYEELCEILLGIDKGENK